MSVQLATTTIDIERCFPVIFQLRPHLDRDAFIKAVQRQRQSGYNLVYLEEHAVVKAVAGFRVIEMLVSGPFLYVDDLVTSSDDRSKGYGAALFEWLVDFARTHGCHSIQLDSGVQRARAHRFYFRQGMKISSYHFVEGLSHD